MGGEDSRHPQRLYAVIAGVFVVGLYSTILGVLDGQPRVALVGAGVAATMIGVGIVVRRGERR